jgi:hypothetical protein
MHMPANIFCLFSFAALDCVFVRAAVPGLTFGSNGTVWLLKHLPSHKHVLRATGAGPEEGAKKASKPKALPKATGLLIDTVQAQHRSCILDLLS